MKTTTNDQYYTRQKKKLMKEFAKLCKIARSPLSARMSAPEIDEEIGRAHV